MLCKCYMYCRGSACLMRLTQRAHRAVGARLIVPVLQVVWQAWQVVGAALDVYVAIADPPTHVIHAAASTAIPTAGSQPNSVGGQSCNGVLRA